MGAMDRETLRFVGVGFSFIAQVGLCGGLGYWGDSKLGTSPWLLLVGVLFGTGAATYSLLKRVAVMEKGGEWTPKSKDHRAEDR